MTETIDIRASLAMSKGAVTAAEAGEVMSEEGVPIPLDKGDNHVLVLIPVRCCDHHATRAHSEEPVAVPAGPDQIGLEFNTDEHIITVA